MFLEVPFSVYKHVFGQTNSEIKPDKLIKDNKFLYVLLPPLEQAPAQIEILGKILIMTIREVTALALGGDTVSIHKTLINIKKDKLTPKPFTLVVLDEYGAYPVDGIDTLLAQVRSYNISLFLGIQDYASLKAGGDNQTSQERALANTGKWLFQTEDKTGIEWIESMIPENLVMERKFQKDAHNNLVETTDVEISREKYFNPSLLRDFRSGFSVILSGGDDTGITFMQSFYRGGKAGNVFVKRKTNIHSV